MTKILLIIFLGIFVKCNSKKNEKFSEYKMISYESKAWVDTFNFPSIKIYNNNEIEIIKNKKVEFFGNMSAEKFVLNNGNPLKFLFLDSSQTKLQIWNLVSINVEAHNGIFEKVK